MVKEVQVAAFDGGKLQVQGSGENGREVVLALPLSRLIVKMVKVPAETEAVAFASPLLQAMSPYPDEPLTVSCEFVREVGGERVMIAAAMPEEPTDDIAEALDAAKLNVVRIDAIVLGEIRHLWNTVGVSGEARKLVVVAGPTCLTLVALDAEQPSALRALPDASDLVREAMLVLLEAEDFGGEKRLAEVVWVGDDLENAAEKLSVYAPVRKVGPRNIDAALLGVAERTGEEGALNVLPASWREVLEQTRFKAKVVRRLAVAGGVWALVMGTLFAVPAVYDYRTSCQKDLCRQHEKQYRSVKDMKAKVDIVHKYSDHARGALEIMKAVSDRLPSGIELTSWDFNRENGVTISGESEESTAVYEFKDKIAAMGAEEEGGEVVFQVVNLGALSSGKGGRQRFRLDCQFKAAEE